MFIPQACIHVAPESYFTRYLIPVYNRIHMFDLTCISIPGTRTTRTGYTSVCVLHIKPFFLPVDIQYDQCWCRFFNTKDIYCAGSVVTKLHVEILILIVCIATWYVPGSKQYTMQCYAIVLDTIGTTWTSNDRTQEKQTCRSKDERKNIKRKYGGPRGGCGRQDRTTY